MERLTRFFAALTRWGLGLCALLLLARTWNGGLLVGQPKPA